MLHHLSRYLIFTCSDLIFWLTWDTISRCFSTIFILLAIFWIPVKHSILTSWSFSCCSRMLILGGVMSHSTFLLLFISSFKLMISSFNLMFYDSTCESFSFNIVTLWVVAWDKATNAISTVTRFSLVFSNKSSSS